MKKIAFATLAFLIAQAVAAQSGRYLIQLRDKAQNPYSLSRPEAFLSARSIERRTRYNIACDSTDLPVTPQYIDSLRAVPNVTVLNVSKWLNLVSIQTTETALRKIRQFPFVQSATFIAARAGRKSDISEEQFSEQHDQDGMQAVCTTGAFDYGVAAAQVAIHNGQFLHNIGLQGQGMIVSLLDAGFFQFTALKAFDSVNKHGQVLGTWDFVAREQSVSEDHPHGMQCFSTIAANIPGVFVGTAPQASFYLFRSEDAGSEYPVEEHNWTCAAERADSAGSDVISSSLGYNRFNDASLNHAYGDMDGDKTIAARGADLAAKKGLLVVSAAGNEGASGWKFITTPADGDSVLAVGAVNAKGAVALFSSYGPSADGQVKPDVASVGVSTIIQATDNTIAAGNGTSFACPNMAGLVTCLWQGFPEYDNMKIINALRRSGNNADTPDNRTGYGIPDVKKAVRFLLQDFATASVSHCKTLNWTSKDMSAMRYEIERQRRGETGFTTIAQIQSTGKNFQTRRYQFVDSSLAATDGPARYSIRQVIDTAAATFAAFVIDTLTITAAACTPVPAFEGSVQLIPNPAAESFFIKIDNGAAVSNLQIVVVNAIGQKVHAERSSKRAAMALIPVRLAGVAPGFYYVLLYDGTKKLAAKRFIKL